jgi:hypothetical protein
MSRLAGTEVSPSGVRLNRYGTQPECSIGRLE